MKRIVLVSLAGMLFLAATWPAAAQPGGRERPHRRERFERDQDRLPPAPPPSQVQSAAPEGAAGGGRMSREERRQLRRDIHEAGRDLYPLPPPRERPPQP
jgi:hypothetical protein